VGAGDKSVAVEALGLIEGQAFQGGLGGEDQNEF